MKEPTNAALRELALVYLRLGFTAFGGPAAHIALMEQEAVSHRQWLSKQEFLDLLGAANLIPGPSSTQLAIFIGYRRAGWHGLMVAGCCFILPAAAITLALAFFYMKFGLVPAAAGLLYGLKPVMIAIIVQAIWNLGRTAVGTISRGVLSVAALAASLAGFNPLLVLLAAGVINAFVVLAAARHDLSRLRLFFVPPLMAMIRNDILSRQSVGLVALFWRFLKLGSVVIGSGYTLIAFLRADLVERTHWLTNQQLLDAITVGQITPGPVFSTATFIGFLLGGVPGAAVATLAIFLPSFLMIAVGGPLLPRLQKSPVFSAFIAGASTAALSLMAAVVVQLVPVALVDPWCWLLAIGSAILLLRFGVNSSFIIAIGAVVGITATFLK